MRTRPWLMVGLVAVNLVLAGGMVLKFTGKTGSLESAAYAQSRNRPNYIVASGHTNGQPIQYVLDTNSGNLHAYSIDSGKKDIFPVASVNVENDARRAFSR